MVGVGVEVGSCSVDHRIDGWIHHLYVTFVRQKRSESTQVPLLHIRIQQRSSLGAGGKEEEQR